MRHSEVSICIYVWVSAIHIINGGRKMRDTSFKNSRDMPWLLKIHNTFIYSFSLFILIPFQKFNSDIERNKCLKGTNRHIIVHIMVHYSNKP